MSGPPLSCAVARRRTQPAGRVDSIWGIH